MSDMISRQAAINKINERQRELIYRFGFENDVVKIMDIAKSIVSAIPSAQPEQKKGRWVNQKGGGCCCSECGRYALDEIDGNFIHVAAKSNYCPNCGAEMGEGDSD